MKKSQNRSNAQTSSDHGRRDFLSLSLLAGSTLLLSAESHGQTPLTKNDDLAIANSVGIADSIALYTNLLEDVRRSVLQKDAQMIYVAKYEATDWLSKTTSDAERFRSLLTPGATLTDRQKEDLRYFLFEVDSGGKEISRGLIRMRQQPLEEIKNLDTDFDTIRAELTAASNAVKNHNPGKAKEAIASAINRLNKYTPSLGATANQAQEQGQEQPRRPQQRQQGLPSYQPVAVRPTTLRELLQTVLDLLNATPTSPRPEQNHSRAVAGRVNYSSIPIEPLFQTGITAVLRSKLNPASWLQVGIGYAVAFPILLRVSDKNNRIKLLNDALRLVPPGLRNPLLTELANDLANLP